MNILVCGASGFVGRHLRAALSAAGHRCINGVRKPRGEGERQIDYLHDLTPQAWLPKLEGIDVVINAVGILRDSAQQPMSKILAAAPSALFQAAALAGVQRCVNFSALGVESDVQTPYFQHRRSTESVLCALPAEVRWLNLRPSVIYGEDGASARMFRLLASLPVHGLPMGGTQRMQPVHIDDVMEAVVRWLADPLATNQNVNAAGAHVASMREMLDSYRQQLGHGAALHIPIPGPLVKLAARLGDLIPASPLCSDTLTMLDAGNTGDNSGFSALLGRQPLSYKEFIAKEARA